MSMSSKTKVLLAALSAAATVGLAAPAVAAPSGTGSPLTVETRHGKIVYCLTGAITGSRIPDKVCQTKERWEADGVQFKVAQHQSSARPDGKASQQHGSN